MYIDSLEIRNLRSFDKTSIAFLCPAGDSSDSSGSASELASLPRAKLPNVNLLLGDNGSGKTTLLKAIALAALGPAADSAGIFPHSLVRRIATKGRKRKTAEATIEAVFQLHDQDRRKKTKDPVLSVRSSLTILRRYESEKIFVPEDYDKIWEPVFGEKNDAFFFAGYGATRRVEPGENLDIGARQKRSTGRGRRVLGLFEESYSLVPMTYWLPRLRRGNPARYKQIVALINRLLERRYRFTGELERGDYLFGRGRGRTKVPFHALSDGYRAFLGWVGDLLYHVSQSCPPGKKLSENRGIVMVDEIDLHLHPRWQMRVIPTLARALPKLQFIVASHSPLVTGTLEWMNVLYMKTIGLRTVVKRLEESIYGLDADQILLSDFFGLKTTRAPEKADRIERLTLEARKGDRAAAKALLDEMSKGMEQAS